MSCLKQIQYRFALFRNLYFGKVCSSLTEVCILIRFSGLESAASAPAAPTDNVPKQMPGQLCKTKAYMELVLVWLLIALYTSFFFLIYVLYVSTYTNMSLLQRSANARDFSPGQRKVKESQELSQRGLIHHVYHAHFCDQEVQDTASGGN